MARGELTALRSLAQAESLELNGLKQAQSMKTRMGGQAARIAARATPAERFTSACLRSNVGPTAHRKSYENVEM